MTNPIQASKLTTFCEPEASGENLDPQNRLAHPGNEHFDEVRISSESQMMLNELTRLTAEAVQRANNGLVLPCLASLAAVQPLVANLLGLISKDLQEQVPTNQNDMMPDGVYL